MNRWVDGAEKPRPLAAHIMLIAVAAALAGCSNGGPPPLDRAAGLACVDDSAHCIKTRIATMKALSADKDRRWIKQRASPKAYATGVRLFALRNKKAELTCDELIHARSEAKGARVALRRPGAGLSPAQISRATMLANEVRRDLSREYKRRCKGR